MYSVGVGGPLTGRGARVLVIDDPVSDFVAAHSPRIRQNLWDWWLSVAQTRLEPPYLVMVTMTRWHEDDFVGRLFNEEYEGDPKDWERIVIPALAEKDDILGRAVDEPLLSPIIDEDLDAATRRWEQTKINVGSYTWFGMYQQRPAPPKGAIFDAGWWKFWTWDPEKVQSDGRVVLLDPGTITGGEWLDSWDLNFDSEGDYVVGQRWVKVAANRFLLDQVRGRWAFTETLRKMQRWAGIDPSGQNDPLEFDPYDINQNPWGQNVHLRLIEKKANGAAAINVLKDKISGLKPINPTMNKEVRARSVTPEVESGNVYLPHPSDPGNEWVTDLLSELRNFPHDANDDQVDALSQALMYFRPSGKGQITNPASQRQAQRFQRPRSLTEAARSDLSRRRR
jgi:predicted phage terminase large subunit-like protein